MIYFAAGCFLLLLYSYIGFPLLVALLARVRPRKWRMDETYRPTVSIILPAFNESLVLRRCLESLLAQNYPHEKIEILCGSDGSTDQTNAILNEIAEQTSVVRPFFFLRQRGKMLTLNDLVSNAQSEILLFVDADVTLNPNAVLSHVRHYVDSSVGGVAGRLIIASERTDGIFRSESTFLSFESNLRRNEAEIGSTVGLYGGNYSIRRKLWKQLPDDRVYDDFFAVLTIVSEGWRLLYEEGAISTEIYGRNYREERARKKRNASRCLYTLRFMPSTLFRGTIAWLLWPHKILRWMTGFLAVGMVVGSVWAYLNGESWMLSFLVAEILSILLVLVGGLARNAKRPIPLASGLYWFFRNERRLSCWALHSTLLFTPRKPSDSGLKPTRLGEPSHNKIVEQEVLHS